MRARQDPFRMAPGTEHKRNLVRRRGLSTRSQRDARWRRSAGAREPQSRSRCRRKRRAHSIDEQHARGLVLHLGRKGLHLFNSTIEQLGHCGRIAVRGGPGSGFRRRGFRRWEASEPIWMRQRSRWRPRWFLSARSHCAGWGSAAGRPRRRLNGFREADDRFASRPAPFWIRETGSDLPRFCRRLIRIW